MLCNNNLNGAQQITETESSSYFTFVVSLWWGLGIKETHNLEDNSSIPHENLKHLDKPAYWAQARLSINFASICDYHSPASQV